MPEQPELTPTPLKSLAERYGMTAESIEDILRGTHEEYRAASPTLPVEETPVPPIVEAAKVLPPTPPATVPPPLHRTRPISGGFMVAIFTVLLIALGIAISFRRGCFEQRSERTALKPVDTIQTLLQKQAEKASTPPETPSDVPPDVVPKESLEVPNVAPLETPRAPKKEAQHEEKTSTTKPSLETSSSYEAEEQLAELRADGATKAHIERVKKNGSTRYRVYSK